MTKTGKTTRSQRTAMPLARDVVKDIAINTAAASAPCSCAAPTWPPAKQNSARPCGHTLASVCPAAPNGPRTCAPRNAARAGTSTVNLTSSPTPPPMTTSGGSRSAPRSRPAATAATAGTTRDLDQLLAELDDEIARAGMRGDVAPIGASAVTGRPGGGKTPRCCRAARSTRGRSARPTRRRRQDLPPSLFSPSPASYGQRHRRRHSR